MDNLNVQTDHEPLHVTKPNDQNVHYKQQVNVRFLQPPSGPEPAPIIIKVNILIIANVIYICMNLGTSRTSSPTASTGGCPTTSTHSTNTSTSYYS
jgi:hypothetical protein